MVGVGLLYRVYDIWYGFVLGYPVLVV